MTETTDALKRLRERARTKPIDLDDLGSGPYFGESVPAMPVMETTVTTKGKTVKIPDDMGGATVRSIEKSGVHVLLVEPAEKFDARLARMEVALAKLLAKLEIENE